MYIPCKGILFLLSCSLSNLRCAQNRWCNFCSPFPSCFVLSPPFPVICPIIYPAICVLSSALSSILPSIWSSGSCRLPCHSLACPVQSYPILSCSVLFQFCRILFCAVICIIFTFILLSFRFGFCLLIYSHSFSEQQLPLYITC